MFKNKLSTTKTMLGLGAAAAAIFSSGSLFAGTITISGSGWNTAATASNPAPGTSTYITHSGTGPSGTTLSYGAYATSSSSSYTNAGKDSASAGYSSNSGGSAQLSLSNSSFWTDADAELSGNPGTLGILRFDTMSYTVPTNTATLNSTSVNYVQPYAIFGINDGNGDLFDVINDESGSGAYSINSSSIVSIFSFKTDTFVAGTSGGNGKVLSSLYNILDPTGVEYGDAAVTAAFANIGSFGSTTGYNETADIGSMTVTTPEPATLGLLSLGGLGLLLKRRRKAIA